MELKIKKLNPKAQIPHRATPGSAGMDLRACMDAPLCLASLERALVPTGLAIALPSAQYVALVFARSGLALREGLSMANGVGVIDSDYRGELCVPVVNLSNEAITIEDGERVAQLVIMPVELPDVIEETDALDETSRGSGGFGSTGKV